MTAVGGDGCFDTCLYAYKFMAGMPEEPVCFITDLNFSGTDLDKHKLQTLGPCGISFPTVFQCQIFNVHCANNVDQIENQR